MAMADAYDCILIGSGPGGYVAAIRAAQLGMKTAVIEKDDVVGGRCLNYACIPAKAVLRSADVLSEVRDADEFGISLNGADLTVDFAQVGNRRDKVIKTLTGGVSGLFKKNGIEVISGHGSVTEDGNVKVGGDFDGTEYEVRKAVILATGSVAKPIPGTEFGPRILDTQGAWLLDELPDSIAVVGAGASGTEIASGYARLGVDVHLFEGLDRVLPLEDTDVSRVAERAFKKQGIKVHTSTLVEDVQAGERTVTFKYGDNQELTVEYLVIAAGRGPDIEGLGLDSAGIALDQNGQVEVDGAMRTSKEGVWAIGDLVHGPALAHKASDEGIIAVEDAAGIETHTSTSRAPPSAHRTSAPSG
jgi:dihydrolipoamide dehydrogenase